MKWDHVIEGFAQQVKGWIFTNRQTEKCGGPISDFYQRGAGFGNDPQGSKLVLYIFPYKPSVNSSGFGFSF